MQTMKLELGIIPINDIQFGPESKVENGTIYVNADELKALILEDEAIKSGSLILQDPERASASCRLRMLSNRV